MFFTRSKKSAVDKASAQINAKEARLKEVNKAIDDTTFIIRTVPATSVEYKRCSTKLDELYLEREQVFKKSVHHREEFCIATVQYKLERLGPVEKAEDCFQEAKAMYLKSKSDSLSSEAVEECYHEIIIKCNKAKLLKEQEMGFARIKYELKSVFSSDLYNNELSKMNEKYPFPGAENFQGDVGAHPRRLFDDSLSLQKSEKIKLFERDVNLLIADVNALIEKSFVANTIKLKF